MARPAKMIHMTSGLSTPPRSTGPKCWYRLPLKQSAEEVAQSHAPVEVAHVHAHLVRRGDAAGVLLGARAGQHLADREHQDGDDDDPAALADQVEQEADHGDEAAQDDAGQRRQLAHRVGDGHLADDDAEGVQVDQMLGLDLAVLQHGAAPLAGVQPHATGPRR